MHKLVVALDGVEVVASLATAQALTLPIRKPGDAIQSRDFFIISCFNRDNIVILLLAVVFCNAMGGSCNLALHGSIGW